MKEGNPRGRYGFERGFLEGLQSSLQVPALIIVAGVDFLYLSPCPF
jgi:hypothetical protein